MHQEQALLYIAFAGLATSLGAKPEDINSIYGNIMTQTVPESPGEIALAVKEAVENYYGRNDPANTDSVQE